MRPRSGHLRAARPPGFGRPAGDSSRAADQMGITRGREADHSVPRGPSWLRKEVTDRRAANTRESARVGRGLAAGDVGWRWLRLPGGAAHHGLAPGAQAGASGRPGRLREAAERPPRLLRVGRRLWGPAGRAAGEGCCQLAQLARGGRSEPQASRVTSVADPGPGGGSQGGFPFMG